MNCRHYCDILFHCILRKNDKNNSRTWGNCVHCDILLNFFSEKTKIIYDKTFNYFRNSINFDTELDLNV